MFYRNDPDKNRALRIIMLFGCISLLGDISYEGARSVNGAFLQILGANAATVGLIAGIGEFIGYALRLFSGMLADRTRAYWVFAFIGYGLIASVPLMTFAGTWKIALVFILMERLGKAFRSPAKDTIVSVSAKKIGTGLGFGIMEAMDQIGAVTGPLIFSFILAGGALLPKTIGDYRFAYAWFVIPFALLMLCVWSSYKQVPHPEKAEPAKTAEPEKLSEVFWLYTAFTFATCAGFTNFILVAYHLKAGHIVSDAHIPMLYAVAMAVDAFAAIAFGMIYDRLNKQSRHANGGMLTLFALPIISAVIPFMAFGKNIVLIINGVVLWGIVMGAQETIMRSAIADLTPIKKRGTGYGIFNTATGVAMLISGYVMGLLYDFSVPILAVSAAVLQLIAFGLILRIKTVISAQKAQNT